MTAAMPSATPNETRARYLLVAVAASVVHMLGMIPGYSEGGSLEIREWLIVLAISLAVGVLVFWFVVPSGSAVTGIVLGVAAIVSVGIFWAGLTLPLAAAAGVVSWRAWKDGERSTPAMVGLALSAIAVVALVVIVVTDAAGS